MAPLPLLTAKARRPLSCAARTNRTRCKLNVLQLWYACACGEQVNAVVLHCNTSLDASKNSCECDVKCTGRSVVCARASSTGSCRSAHAACSAHACGAVKPSGERVCLAPRRHSRGLLDTLARPRAVLASTSFTMNSSMPTQPAAMPAVVYRTQV